MSILFGEVTASCRASALPKKLASATSGSLTTTYTTDLFGRRTEARSSAGVTAYDWDALGHLARITSGDTTSTYAYGPTGMRERAVVESSEGTTTTECVWNGQQLAMSRVSTAAGERTYRFVCGPGGLPLELIAYDGTTKIGSYAYVCDRAGSVIGLTDAAGTLVAWHAYDPWGNPLDSGGTDARLAEDNPLRYRGYYFDASTGLYYMPTRYYDPGTGRFLSADPASPSAGNPLTLNRYAYCVGDPVNLSDPSGAIPDYDGDGRRGTQDAQYYMEKHAGTPEQSRVYGAKADVSYYSQYGTAQQVVAAQYELFELTGWPGFPTESLVAADWASTPGSPDFALVRVLMGWSAEDWNASGADVTPVLIRTMLGLPFSPSVWLTAGGVALMVFGGMVAVAGTGLACTGLGLPVGGGVILGGAIIFAAGAGLTACGITGIEVETGYEVVPWYER